MTYALLADLAMVVHFAFTLFVTLGALLVLWRPRIAWAHVPCLAYGAAIELIGWVCPLTPLERTLRRAAGTDAFETGFLEHYLGRILYPADWETLHVWLGVALIAFNAIIYWRVVARNRARRAEM